MSAIYMLIRPNEDGCPIALLTAEQLKPYLDQEDGYGEIKRWLPLAEVLKSPNADYGWEEGDAALFEVRHIVPGIPKRWILP